MLAPERTRNGEIHGEARGLKGGRSVPRGEGNHRPARSPSRRGEGGLAGLVPRARGQARLPGPDRVRVRHPDEPGHRGGEGAPGEGPPEVPAVCSVRAAVDPSARDTLILSCQGLVWGLAASFCRSHRMPFEILEDLAQWGQEGLIDAAERWDGERPFPPY